MIKLEKTNETQKKKKKSASYKIGLDLFKCQL